MAQEVTHISAGPWGGQYGCRWDDGAHCHIRQVVIASSAVVDSIRFEYDSIGLSIWSEKHGGSGGKLDRIKLDYPSEYLVSISGHCGSVSGLEPVVVRSLLLESNRKKYGPFGIPQGTSFSLPISGGKLVGFHGRSSWYLDSIGVYVKPHLHQTIQTPSTIPAAPVLNHGKSEVVNRTMVVTHGPWGGSGGMTFDDGVHTGVRAIHLTRSGGLVSIRICYDQNTRAVWGDKNGGKGGFTKEKIVFDYPNELLTHITGYYASTILRGPTIVKSITFHTNKKSYGPFGDQQGNYFCSGSKQGVIIGFHGRKGYFIDSIGVHVLETKQVLLPPAYPSNMKACEVVPLPRETGFWSGDGEKPRETGYRELVPLNRKGDKLRETGYREPVSLDKDVGKQKEIRYSEPVPWNKDGEKPREIGYREPVPLNGKGDKLKETGYREPVSLDKDGGKQKETRYSEPVMWNKDGGKPKETGSREFVLWVKDGGKPREAESHEAGPWGGDGGKPWDDGAYTGIRKIFVTRGEAICSIQIEYDRNGQSVWSAKHGHDNNTCTYIIKFDYPHEMLTSVSGYYGLVSENGGTSKVVRSLTFYTDVAKYGPFGEEKGTYFSSAKTGGKVVGFHGRSGDYLDAIGVHIQQYQQQQQQWMTNKSSYQFGAESQAMRVVLSKILV